MWERADGGRGSPARAYSRRIVPGREVGVVATDLQRPEDRLRGARGAVLRGKQQLAVAPAVAEREQIAPITLTRVAADVRRSIRSGAWSVMPRLPHRLPRRVVAGSGGDSGCGSPVVAVRAAVASCPLLVAGSRSRPARHTACSSSVLHTAHQPARAGGGPHHRQPVAPRPRGLDPLKGVGTSEQHHRIQRVDLGVRTIHDSVVRRPPQQARAHVAAAHRPDPTGPPPPGTLCRRSGTTRPTGRPHHRHTRTGTGTGSCAGVCAGRGASPAPAWAGR